MCLHKQNLIVNHTQLQHRLTFTIICYSYTSNSTPMKQRELVVNYVWVECRLSFAVVVVHEENWKQPLP